jgi:hypothetical protein
MCVDRFWEYKSILYFNFAVMKETHISIKRSAFRKTGAEMLTAAEY